jgi:hypothetical protein
MNRFLAYGSSIVLALTLAVGGTMLYHYHAPTRWGPRVPHGSRTASAGPPPTFFYASSTPGAHIPDDPSEVWHIVADDATVSGWPARKGPSLETYGITRTDQIGLGSLGRTAVSGFLVSPAGGWDLASANATPLNVGTGDLTLVIQVRDSGLGEGNAGADQQAFSWYDGTSGIFLRSNDNYFGPVPGLGGSITASKNAGAVQQCIFRRLSAMNYWTCTARPAASVWENSGVASTYPFNPGGSGSNIYLGCFSGYSDCSTAEIYEIAYLTRALSDDEAAAWQAGFYGTMSNLGPLESGRSTPGFYPHPDGSTIKVPSGVNRTGPAGVLAEAAGTNLTRYSEQFDNGGGWTPTGGAVVTANVTSSPGSNSLTADRIQIPAGTSADDVQSPIGGSFGGTTVSASLSLRAHSGSSKASIRITSPAVADYFSPDFTLTSQWQRVCFTQAIASGGSGSLNFAIQRDAAGEAVDVDATQAQLEMGPNCTSYVGPTLSSAVGRGADAISRAGVAQSATWSAALDVKLNGLNAYRNNVLSTMGSSSTPTRVLLTIWGSGTALSGKAFCEYYDGVSGFNSLTSSTALTPGVSSHVSCSYDGTNMKICVDGSCASAAATLPADLSSATILIGDGSFENGSYPANGTLKNVCWGKLGACR